MPGNPISMSVSVGLVYFILYGFSFTTFMMKPGVD